MSDAPQDHSAIFLSEYLLDLNEGAAFLSSLAEADRSQVRARGVAKRVTKGEALFHQGSAHTGVWIVESGRIRTFYTGPSGREITLAYWTEGHFVGGPEVFGRGRHIWSADAQEECALVFLSGPVLKSLVLEIPAVALAVIEGLVAKGKCYSALIQMLGTRSVAERLEQFLLILARARGRPDGDQIVIDREITYEQIATVVGATRQWVTQSLDRLQRENVVFISRREIRIADLDRLASGG